MNTSKGKITCILLLCGIGLLLLKACAQDRNGNKTEFLSERYTKFPYQFAEPDEKYILTNQLREISGLTYLQEHRLLCVNDEKGLIYEYDTEKKTILNQYKFAKPGDFEGIEVVDSTAYVLRSDGKLFQVDRFNKSDPFVLEYITPLKARNDVEGLGYEPSTRSLLLACKGKPGIQEKLSDKRTVYRFRLGRKQLDTLPAIVADLEEIRKILNFSGYARFSIKILKSISPAQGDVTFQPSAIATHPLTGNIYLLGSSGKLLLILNPRGELYGVIKLDRKIFKQPEGICFAPDGTMYVSNEGKGGKANIFKFSYKP